MGALTSFEVVLVICVLSCEAVVGTVSNLVVLVSFFAYTHSCQREATAMFLISLLFADLFVCAVYVPFYTSHLAEKSLILENVTVRTFIGSLLLIASLNAIFCVMMDRFIAVQKSFKYPVWLCDQNVKKVIACSWVLAILPNLVIFINFKSWAYLLNAYVLFMMTAIFFLSYTVFRTSQLQARRIIDQFSNVSAAVVVSTRCARAVRLVVGISLLCWLPTILVPVLIPIFGQGFVNRIWCYVLVMSSLNSCLDPFLYYWNISRFRRAIQKFLKMIVRWKKSNLENNVNPTYG
ncbi:predicted protein [Nematostella vectensis]|uniref:G-protein coupled receptors family 1 profile domain-containing protein n=1 Tax=Nematostella vectensis TaxID=45351 RepID=A7RVZ2_NEMVE|nr:predicted protein [Nematostella vectensis]|eukprot:XP_001636387.1 predicted protein [Nematostella vectensis]